MILEITPFKDLVPFLIPLVVVPIGTTSSAISNSSSAASELEMALDWSFHCDIYNNNDQNHKHIIGTYSMIL